MIAFLAAMAMGAFCVAATLWYGRWGVAPAGALERLNRLRGEVDAPAGTLGSLFGLRRRATLRFGGINLVNANITQRWGIQLERAGLQLNVREYFIMRIGIAGGLMLLLFILSPVKPLAIIGAPIGFLGVGFWVKRRMNKRTQKLESQLVEMLQMLSSGLRAGFGFLQALEGSGEQLQAPLSVEIRRTLRDTSMGASVEQALENLNQRVGSADFDIVITAVLIQRSVGGNLAEILENVAHTMRERERIKGEIRTLTSQQRMTGYVIGGIPVGLGLAFMVISPDFMMLLFTDSLGHILLGVAGVMEAIGFFIINKIVSIEV